MKIYEYARNRGIKSKDVVKRLQEMGFTFIKNHLSLVPEKVLDDLNQYDFPFNQEIKKVIPIDIVLVGMDYKQLKTKINRRDLGRKVIILPYFNIEAKLDIFGEIVVNEEKKQVYTAFDKNIEYYFIELEMTKREKLLGLSDEKQIISMFNLSVIELLKLLNYEFNVINIHDWPLGLFPLLFKQYLKELMPKTQVIFTVYGPTYKGIYGLELLEELKLKKEYYDKTLYAQSVNLLKAGLITADKFDISKDALNELKLSYLKDYVYDNM